jgi:hypothetical protein
MENGNGMHLTRGDAEILNSAIKQLIAKGRIPKEETFADLCQMSYNQLVKRMNGLTPIDIGERWTFCRVIAMLDKDAGEWVCRTITGIQSLRIVE